MNSRVIGHVTTRDAVVITGSDAATFLQGQISADVLTLAVGDGVATLVLAPQGKLVAWARVTRLGDERFRLDVETGFGGAVLERLSRFKIRVTADLEPHQVTAVQLLGAGAQSAAESIAASVLGSLGQSVTPVPGLWSTTDAVDVLVEAGPSTAGPSAISPADVLHAAAEAAGVDLVDHRAMAARRIAARVPAMGSELDTDTIPAEAGVWLVNDSVSFTKGCFVGQELVARVDSRGSNTPRRLRRLSGTGHTELGDRLWLGDKDVGTLTSVAVDPAGITTALAMLHRSVSEGDLVSVGTAGGVTRLLADGPVDGAVDGPPVTQPES